MLKRIVKKLSYLLVLSITLTGCSTLTFGAAANTTYVGTIGLNSSSAMASTNVGTYDTWISNYSFASNLHNIRTGDFNADGKDEFVIVSDQGLAIVRQNSSTSFKSIFSCASNSGLGKWTFNSNSTAGYDRIIGIGDLNGDKKDEILIASDWGIGILAMKSRSALTCLAAIPNGTRFNGGWVLNTQDNRFNAIGDFNGDGRKEILVTSPWGLGVLVFTGSTFTNPVSRANGTSFGRWNLNTYDNIFSGIGDVDGDKKQEIVVTSPWGIGILKVSSTILDSMYMAPNGTRFGDWSYNSALNKIWTISDYNGDGKDELLLSSSNGIGVLRYTGSGLTSVVCKPNGTRFGSWLLNTADNVFTGTGDFNGDGKKDAVIRSPWGIGILTLNGNTFSALDMKPYNTALGSWKLVSDDQIRGIGRYSGGTKAQLLMSTIANSVDLRNIIAKRGITIRDQSTRPTCSVFSMDFLLEYMYTSNFGTRYNNFSEEYLNHAANKAVGKTDDGDFFSSIAAGYDKYGIVNETLWPYGASYVYATADTKMTAAMISTGQKMLSNVFRLNGRFIKPNDGTVGLTTAQFNEIIRMLDNGIPVAVGRSHSMPIAGYSRNAAEAGGGHFIFRNSYGITSDINGYKTESFQNVMTTANDVYVYESLQ
jgi:hypothetical protein